MNLCANSKRHDGWIVSQEVQLWNRSISRLAMSARKGKYYRHLFHQRVLMKNEQMNKFLQEIFVVSVESRRHICNRKRRLTALLGKHWGSVLSIRFKKDPPRVLSAVAGADDNKWIDVYNVMRICNWWRVQRVAGLSLYSALVLQSWTNHIKGVFSQNPSQSGATAERMTRDREDPGSKLACAICSFP